MKCRNCSTALNHVFVDLGTSPASNSFLKEEDLNRGEIYYPLKVMVCDSCFLVQLDEFKNLSDIFSEDYVYYSSFSQSWLKHAADYVDMITERLGLTKSSFVVEVASNDGYLLKNFLKKEIPCLGVEPTIGTAQEARKLGIETLTSFFGKTTANEIEKSKKKKADLILGNNVLAHVPDIHDFLGGFKNLLNADGVITFEFPHLLELVEKNQFDTIYHEHFSYLSLIAVQDLFLKNGLRVFDVERIPTHGGSLRVYGCHQDSKHLESNNVGTLKELELSRGMNTLAYYQGFQTKVSKIKQEFLGFMSKSLNENKTVCGYGAAAKGNTFLNFCGIKRDTFGVVADASPFKQNLYLPGSRIKVVSPETLIQEEPDYIFIFPWNLKKEITALLSKSAKKGTRLVTFIPSFNETVLD